MVKGIVVVFAVMGLIAAGMWLSGKIFISLEAKEKARMQAEAEAEKKAEQEKPAAEEAKSVAERSLEGKTPPDDSGGPKGEEG